MKKLTILFMLAAIALSAAAQSPVSTAKGGYLITMGNDNSFNKAALINAKADVLLVDFSALAKAKTSADSLAIIGKIYQDPTKFSVVTGTLNYVSATSVSLTTNAKFQLDIKNAGLSVVIVQNDGKDNSGVKKAPPQAYSLGIGSGHGCTSCGCDCYRTTRGCTYCGFGVMQTAPRIH